MAIQLNIGSTSSSGDLFRGHRVRVRTLQLALQLEDLGAFRAGLPHTIGNALRRLGAMSATGTRVAA